MNVTLRVLRAFLLKVLVFVKVGVTKVEFNLPTDRLHYVVVLEREEISCTLFLIGLRSFHWLLAYLGLIHNQGKKLFSLGRILLFHIKTHEVSQGQ